MRLACAILLAACSAAPAPVTQEDALTALNRQVRAAYADARTRALAGAGPVLIVGPAHVTLLHDGARREFELQPRLYHDLKTVAHLALGLHSLCFAATPDAARWQTLREAARAALAELEGHGLSMEQLQRQREIVRLSLALADASRLSAYERAVAPLLLANAEDAARAEITDLDRAVAAARQELGEAFARLHVVVVGAHMAREGEIAMQYFGKLLGEREGLRLVFAEGLWDEASQLQLLGTHLLDASVGEGFFGDPLRMHRDLLADGAAKVLAERR